MQLWCEAPQAYTIKRTGQQRALKSCERDATLLLTFLDHLWQVGLSEDFGHPEDHERVFGVNQVGANGSVQETLEQLGVQEQVLLHKGGPEREHSQSHTQTHNIRGRLISKI